MTAFAALTLGLVTAAGAATPVKRPAASHTPAKHLVVTTPAKTRRIAGHQVAGHQAPAPAAKSKAAPARPAARKPSSRHSASEATTPKASPHARARSHHHAIQDDDHEPALMHRTHTTSRQSQADILQASILPSTPPTENKTLSADFPRVTGSGSEGSTAVVPSPKTVEMGIEPQSLQRTTPKPGKKVLFAAGIDTAEVNLAPDNSAALRAKPEARFADMSANSRDELTDDALKPVVLPGLYSRSGRLIVPAPLKGTREILVHQNYMTDQEGLERIQDDDDLNRMRAQHLLINFPESASLAVNHELAANRRCARVWTVRFAADMARSYYARFHQPLQVNSAARTVDYQVRLRRTNGNAAGVDGEVASPHLSGQALDFGKRGMSLAEISWMRAYLKPLMQAGKLDVEEEFQQACFHISVYRSYMPAASKHVARTEVAQLRTIKPVTRTDRDE